MAQGFQDDAVRRYIAIFEVPPFGHSPMHVRVCVCKVYFSFLLCLRLKKWGINVIHPVFFPDAVQLWRMIYELARTLRAVGLKFLFLIFHPFPSVAGLMTAEY